MYYCCGITETGTMPHNEDAFLLGNTVADFGTAEFTLKAPFIAAVSDGVSGERSGEVASRTCLELISGIKLNKKLRLRESLEEVHKQLAEIGRETPETHNMQATLCGIFIDADNNISTINVGDSRLYRFRGGHLRQLSRDQSLVQLLYEKGTITKEQQRTHVQRNIIFPVLGNIKSQPQIDITPLEGGMEYGDILLLCTDGLSDYVSQVAIEEILVLPKSLPSRLEMLVEKALSSGSKDNITIIAVVCCDD